MKLDNRRNEITYKNNVFLFIWLYLIYTCIFGKCVPSSTLACCSLRVQLCKFSLHPLSFPLTPVLSQKSTFFVIILYHSGFYCKWRFKHSLKCNIQASLCYVLAQFQLSLCFVLSHPLLRLCSICAQWFVWGHFHLRLGSATVFGLGPVSDRLLLPHRYFLVC